MHTGEERKGIHLPDVTRCKVCPSLEAKAKKKKKDVMTLNITWELVIIRSNTKFRGEEVKWWRQAAERGDSEAVDKVGTGSLATTVDRVQIMVIQNDGVIGNFKDSSLWAYGYSNLLEDFYWDLCL